MEINTKNILYEKERKIIIMKNACFIPIKSNSESSGEELQTIKWKKLYEYIIENAALASCLDDIYVDTNSEEVEIYCQSRKIIVIKHELGFDSCFTAISNHSFYWYNNMPVDYDQEFSRDRRI